MRGKEGRASQVRKGKGGMQRGLKVFGGKSETDDEGHSWSVCLYSELCISLVWRTPPTLHMVLRGLSVLVLYFPSQPGAHDLGSWNP